MKKYLLPSFIFASVLAISAFFAQDTTVKNISLGAYNPAAGLTGNGTTGYVTRYTAASTLGTGKFIDNGTVTGVNATSSSYTFNVQGNASTNPFIVASSTGTSLFNIDQSGNITGAGNITIPSQMQFDSAVYTQFQALYVDLDFKTLDQSKKLVITNGNFDMFRAGIGGLELLATSTGTSQSGSYGVLYHDTTQKILEFTGLSNLKTAVSGTLFTATASAVVTNTVSDTSAIGTGIGTRTLPANWCAPGKTIRIHGAGIYRLPITGGSATVKIKYGSTLLASVTTTGLLANVPDQRYAFDAYVTCRTAGASGSVSVDGSIKYSSNSATNIFVEDPLNNAGATVTVDTTTSNLLDVTAAFDTAVATKAATTTLATYELLN